MAGILIVAVMGIVATESGAQSTDLGRPPKQNQIIKIQSCIQWRSVWSRVGHVIMVEEPNFFINQQYMKP